MTKFSSLGYSKWAHRNGTHRDGIHASTQSSIKVWSSRGRSIKCPQLEYGHPSQS